MTAELFAAQTALIQAAAAFYTAEQTRLTAEAAALAAVCGAAAAACDVLAALTTADDATYSLREGSLAAMARQYQAALDSLLNDNLKALQYNGIEIDTELIRIFLFGQNLIAAPNP